MTKKFIGPQRFVNIIKPIIESLSPVLSYVQERFWPVAEIFFQRRHNKLDTPNQVRHRFLGYSNHFPVFL